MKIIAAIVTYNRKELLKECIEALLEQTWQKFQILVVDNASTDGTKDSLEEYIRKDQIIYFNTGSNLGGAGGFNRAIRIALEEEADYIWLMDDDTVPNKNALEKMMFTADKLNYQFGFLSGRVLWKDGRLCKMNKQKNHREVKVIAAGEKIIRCRQATFVSFFVKAAVVREIGLPISDFFIWGDDVEYSRRISKKYISYYVPESYVVHKTANNEGSNIAKDAYERISRYKFAYRNEMYIARKEGLGRMIYQISKIFFHILKILFLSNGNRCEKLGVLIKSSFNGIKFNPMIEYYEKENKYSLTKRRKTNGTQRGAIIICHTPFQILNALNFIVSKQEELGKDNIIFVHQEFAEAGEYSQRLRKTGLFLEVMEVNPFNKYDGWKHKLVALKRYIFPKYSLRQHLKTNTNECMRNNYKYLIFSIHSPLVSIIRLLNPDTDIIMIDDGTGSYFGNILTDNPSRHFQIIAKYCFKGVLQMHPKALYLNSTEISETTMDCEICKLNSFKNNDKLLNLIKYVFGYKQTDEYETHRLIYLDQPIELKNSRYQNNYIEFWKILEKTKYSSQVMVRSHPRQEKKNYSHYQQKINNLWELECINTIKNSHILMGIFSTAQFMPRILMGSEPAVIFLYRLVLDESMYNLTRFDNLVECLKKLYSAPEKIIVPESLEKLEIFLEQMF